MPPLPRLLTRLALLAAPVLALGLLYAGLDPWCVLRPPVDFYPAGGRNLELNRDWVSTELYLRRLAAPAAQRPAAFVLGNSRTQAVRAAAWAPYLPPGTPVFHFDASSESLLGIERKVALIRARGGPLQHALVLLDAGTLAQTTDSDGPLFRKHPALLNQSAWRFQADFLRAWLQHPALVWGCLALRLQPAAGSPWPGALPVADLALDEVTNELVRPRREALLAADPAAFAKRHPYARRPAHAYRAAPVIGPAQMVLLKRLRAHFRALGTRYYLIGQPVYRKEGLAEADLATLRRLFGYEQVRDFAADDSLLTPTTNFLDNSHYAPPVATAMLRRLYQPH